MTTPHGPGFDDIDRMSGVKAIKDRIAELHQMDQAVPWVKLRLATLANELMFAEKMMKESQSASSVACGSL